MWSERLSRLAVGAQVRVVALVRPLCRHEDVSPALNVATEVCCMDAFRGALAWELVSAQVKGPLMLEMGVQPAVASATAATMITSAQHSHIRMSIVDFCI